MKALIGDTIYYATCQNERVSVICPVCHGKLEVTLILGNGDSVILPCDYCGKGYNDPRGYVEEYNYVVTATPFTVTGIEIEQSQNGEKRQYRSGGEHCYHIFEENRCFAIEKEALAAAVFIKEQLDKDQSTRSEYLKQDKRKSFSWNAGYHLRQAKDHRRQAEYHEGKAKLCKARSKEEGKDDSGKLQD